MSLIAKTNTSNFEADVLKHAGVVLVDFYADWCGPCKAAEPMLEGLAEEYEGEVKIVKVDADVDTDITGRYSVRGLPTFLIIKDGEVVERFSGAKTRGEFAAAFEKQMGTL